MAPPLTLRNITSTPIELKLIERYEHPGGGQSQGLGGIKSLGDFGRNVTSLVNSTVGNATQPSAPQLAENAESFTHQDVNIRVEPFQQIGTDIAATERGENEVLRLTFEVDGQRYRIDTPCPGKLCSNDFSALVPDPRHRFTAVFLPSETFLSIYSSDNLHCWMQELRDDTNLSAISIPGTHNSPTCHVALPSVRCQAVPPRDQLENGVRFFDIRVQPEKPDDPGHDGLILVHGVFPISLTGNKYFRDLINEVLSFLDRNPSETIIMSIKREGPGNHTDQQLSMILHDHYAQDGSRWYTEPRIPRLGEVRRKIVLMRRFALDDRIKGDNDGRGWALNAENWAYNTPNDTHGDVCVQDFCEVLETENIDQKITYSREHLQRSGDIRHNPDQPNPLYLNFLSASNFWKVGCWPDKIAAKMNPATREHLVMKHHDSQDGDHSTGIVVTDWVGQDGDWDLIRCIVGQNARLEWRQRQGQ